MPSFFKTSARLQSTHTCPATTERKYTYHSYDYPLINLTYSSNSINSQEKLIGSEVQNLPGIALNNLIYQSGTLSNRELNSSGS
jgi:hypothetical protein